VPAARAAVASSDALLIPRLVYLLFYRGLHRRCD